MLNLKILVDRLRENLLPQVESIYREKNNPQDSRKLLKLFENTFHNFAKDGAKSNDYLALWQELGEPDFPELRTRPRILKNETQQTVFFELLFYFEQQKIAETIKRKAKSNVFF